MNKSIDIILKIGDKKIPITYHPSTIKPTDNVNIKCQSDDAKENN